ncbi:MAG: acyl-CoA thioesterase [Bacteriovoracaceae bacterium]|nr:acyl-CoA thioesterase [Bacteriovoracaceae bacterium]
MTADTDYNPNASGDLAIRTLAMPSDANPDGDIFGGWVLSQMDIAGGVITKRLVKGRTVTVAVDAMTFHLPVFVGDLLCCYVSVIKIGNTSIRVKVEAWANRAYDLEWVKVTEGVYTYVAVDKNGKPRTISKSKKQDK